MFLAIVAKILVIVGLFGLTIFIHELGHFLVAKAFGVDDGDSQLGWEHG